jgi:porin
LLIALIGLSTAPIARAGETSNAQPDEGLKPRVIYDGAVFSNLGGGGRNGTTYSSNLHVQVDIDGDKLFGLKDTIAYLDALSLLGGNPSNFVGDAQGVSSISAPNGTRLYEAWVQKNSPGNHVSVLGGLYDLNTEFYRLQSSSLFFNASFGIGPEFAQTGIAGPSIFPSTSVGARLAIKPVEGVVLRMALLDGAPVDRPDGSRRIFAPGDGALIVTEAAFLDRARESTRPATGRMRLGRNAMLGEYDSKLAFGAWHYTKNFSDLSDTDIDGEPIQHRGSSGFYAVADRVLYRSTEGPRTRVNGFIEAGLGDEHVNRFGSYIGTGLTAAGLLAGRPNDEAGIGVAYARNGSHFMASQRGVNAPLTAAETAIELTYLAQLNTWLAVQPDLQYVIHPNTTTAISNAWALQMRFELAF